MIGVPGPRLLPEFFPVIESTEFGRSLPRRVASATASPICCRIQIWLAPTGTFTSKVGMPVSWQIGRCPRDEFDHAREKRGQHAEQYNRADGQIFAGQPAERPPSRSETRAL